MEGTIEQITERGFAKIPCRVSRQEFESAVGAYRFFDECFSFEEKEETKVRFDEDQRITFGWEDKSIMKGKDRKTYFHYNPFLLGGDINLRRDFIYEELLRRLDVVYRKLERDLRDVLKSLDRNQITDIGRLMDSEGHMNLNLRLNDYFVGSGETGGLLAAPHIDRGIGTLAAYESSPGLRFYDENENPHEVSHEEGFAKLFAAEKWNNHFRIKQRALKHDVVDKGHNQRRASIVAFINAQRTVA